MSRTRPGQGCVCFSKGGLGNLVRGSCMVGSLFVAGLVVPCAIVAPLAAAAMPRPTTPTACRREKLGPFTLLLLLLNPERSNRRATAGARTRGAAHGLAAAESLIFFSVRPARSGATPTERRS